MKNSVAFPHLLRSSILADMADDRKTSFLDECSMRHYTAPTELLTQGAPAYGIYMIAYGRIEVSYTDDEGNLALIHMAGPGEILGEAEALTENPCAATCTTMPDTTVLFCPTPLLYDQIHSPVFVRNLINILYERLTRDNKFRSVNQFYSLEQRLCIYLCQVSSITRPEVVINQAHLASAIGCSRQTINRKLQELRDEGLIGISKGAIKILSRDKLQNRVDQLL